MKDEWILCTKCWDAAAFSGAALAVGAGMRAGTGGGAVLSAQCRPRPAGGAGAALPGAAPRELRPGRELGIIACEPRVQHRSTHLDGVWAEVEPYFRSSLIVSYFYCAMSFFKENLHCPALLPKWRTTERAQHSIINISYVSAGEAYFVRVDQDVSA